MVGALPTCQSVYTEILDHPVDSFGDPYLLTKFYGDPMCHFEIIANLIFRRFGLKVPIHVPKMGCYGSDPLNGE